MSNKCFCHLNGLVVKDATARAEIEALKETAVNAEYVEQAIQTALANTITTVVTSSY